MLRRATLVVGVLVVTGCNPATNPPELGWIPVRQVTSGRGGPHELVCNSGESLFGGTPKSSFEWSFHQVGGIQFRIPGATGPIDYYDFEGWRWDYMMVAPHAWATLCRAPRSTSR